MNFDMNEILRENAREDMKEAAKSIYILFCSLCEAGFTDKQAMEIVTAVLRNVKAGGQQ